MAQLFQESFVWILRTLTVPWRYPGVNLTPSANSISGQDSRNDSTVITEKRFMSSIASCITRQIFFYCDSSPVDSGNLMKGNSPCHRQGVSCWGHSLIGWSDWTPWRSKTQSWGPTDKITVSTVKILPIIWVATAKGQRVVGRIGSIKRFSNR